MKRLYITLLLSVIATSIYASGNSLSLAECRDMAIKSNLSLRSSAQEIQRSELILKAYKTNSLPALSAGGNYLYSTASYDLTLQGGMLPTFDSSSGKLAANGGYAYMPNIDFHAKAGSIFNLSATLAQPIYMGGKINNAIKLAKVGVSAAKESLRLTKAEIIAQSDEAYFTLLKVEELSLAAESYRAVVEEFHRQMQNAVEAGMKSQNDLLKVDVTLGDARLKEQRAKNGVRLAKMNLCYAIGLPLTTTDITLEEVAPSNFDIDPNNLDITKRAEYALLKEQISAREIEESLSKSEFRPSLTAMASYGYLNGATLNNAPLLNGASFIGGVSLNVPIFHWGEGRKRSNAAKINTQIAQNTLDDSSKMMTLELLKTINEFQEATLEVELTAMNLTQAKENMRLSQNHYDQGMETTADLLEAQALWQNAMASHAEAKASQRVKYTLYQKARGEL